MNAENLHYDPVVELCKQGNTKAYRQLYEHYSKRMFNTIYRIVNNRTDAEDVLQDTFVDAFQYLPGYRYESHFSYWLKRIAINKSISFLRKQKSVLIEFDPETHETQLPPEEGQTENWQHVQIEQLKKAIRLLPEHYKVVFNLYAFEGYDHDEIAEILGISHNTVRTQYSRAKQKIKEIIEQNKIYA